MSLKAFHIVFIGASTLLAFGVSAWCFRQYFEDHKAGDLILAQICLVSGIALVIYGKKMLRKLKGFDLI